MPVQTRLKNLLQDEVEPAQLERLAAALLGRLMGVTIAVAKTGFQHGGDAGPSGRQGRRFRIECKRYSDKTSLSDRELLGEIDHALTRDPALEAWILVATRDVPEQLEQDLDQKSEKVGVPIVTLDWKPGGIASLAALCASAPDLVEEFTTAEAGALARQLQPASDAAIEQIRRDLQSWSLGFGSLRAKSWERIEKIWTNRGESNAHLGQDAAGGAVKDRICRGAVHDALDTWWQGTAQSGAPAVVVGWDGVGKTWATLDWLVDRRDVLPITVVVPSSAAAVLTAGSAAEVKRFFANSLYEITGVRNASHWLLRLDNLLKRPSEEGPVLAVFFDGLNQEPSVPWLQLLKTLQGEAFGGRVRVLVSTRTHFYTDKLRGLRSLIVPAIRVNVDVFNINPGGELDQLLEFRGLTRADLHPDIIELARNPRLFRLVIHLKSKVAVAGQVTIHRLLWEYGRDTFGYRDGKSFSDKEWLEWLQELARRCRNGMRPSSTKELSDTAARADLTQNEIYARLSDIIDGRFGVEDSQGRVVLTPTVVAHALAVALLAELGDVPHPTFDLLHTRLMKWLDPIAGLDQRAELLRAAVSIRLEQEPSTTSPVASVLVTAWLQTQNVTDEHRLELAALAENLCEALLDCIEHSADHTQASARLWGVNALRAIPRTSGAAFAAICRKGREWMSVVSRDLRKLTSDADKNRAERFINRIGVDASGPIRVLGVDLQLVDWENGSLSATLPSILEGFPLADAMQVFETAAIAGTVNSRGQGGWDGLKWLCLLNDLDPVQTTEALRAVSCTVRTRQPETGVSPMLPARAAALLLWMTGEEDDEAEAGELGIGWEDGLTYENDYLPDPGRSFFPLERRHAQQVFESQELPLRARLQRGRELWLDPTFIPPHSFVQELREEASHFPVEKIHTHHARTIEDSSFEELEPVLARCAPDLLAELIRRRLQSVGNGPSGSAYWSAIAGPEYLLLSNGAESAAAKDFRIKATFASESDKVTAATNLLVLELHDQPLSRQVEEILNANLSPLYLDLGEILQPPQHNETDALIERFGTVDSSHRRDLLTLFCHVAVTPTENAWTWLTGIAFGSDPTLHGMAFFKLEQMYQLRFGKELVSRGWQWSAASDLWVNHHGSGALIEATGALPFEQIALRLAPWRLLEAVRRRGCEEMEVRLACSAFGEVLGVESVEIFDLGVTILADRADHASWPMTLSVTDGEPNDTVDPIAALRAATDIESRQEAFKRTAETAAERIREARTAGANLYLIDIGPEDFEAVIAQAPEFIDAWLEGMDKLTSDFRRRVHRAETVYLSLCEALLRRKPAQGVTLWKSLEQVVRTRFIGVAGVDDLILIAFRSPDTPEVMQLRTDIADTWSCSTDRDLFNLAIAATSNRKGQWLNGLIDEDKASAFSWRRKRGIVLEGFTSYNKLPIPDAWPENKSKTGHETLYRKSCRSRFRESCASHWWKVFLASKSPVDSYAAWVLFLRAADRRAWIWVNDERDAADDGSSLFRLKIAHARLNKNKVETWMKKFEDGFEKKFLSRDIINGVGPWGKVR